MIKLLNHGWTVSHLVKHCHTHCKMLWNTTCLRKYVISNSLDLAHTVAQTLNCSIHCPHVCATGSVLQIVWPCMGSLSSAIRSKRLVHLLCQVPALHTHIFICLGRYSWKYYERISLQHFEFYYVTSWY